MGSPRRLRKKYATPQHPWRKTRIEEEKILTKEYGFKNKKGIWKADSLLRKIASQAKRLSSLATKQSEIEKAQFLERMITYGLADKNAKLEDILTINLRSVLERRLQTLVYKKNLARSVKQARQFITHRHISVAGKVITTPSYIVTKAEEDKISFSPSSTLNDINHPERTPQEEKKKKVVKKKPIQRRSKYGKR